MEEVWEGDAIAGDDDDGVDTPLMCVGGELSFNGERIRGLIKERSSDSIEEKQSCCTT